MNLNELYNIALDMVSEKKSNGFGFSIDDSSTITVLVTDDGEVFKASNGTSIHNGRLHPTCSEQEAITLMLKSNKSRIDYIVSLDVESGNFAKPCGECLQLMAQIDKDNADCNVMLNDNETVKLSTLLQESQNDIGVEAPKEKESVSIQTPQQEASTEVDFDDWSDGWGDSEPTADTQTETASVLPSRSSQFGGNPAFEDNPIPNQPAQTVTKSNSSYYQSRYLNATPNSADVQSFASATTFRKQQNNDITDRMRQKGLSDGDKKDFNKQRLYNAFTVENVTNLNGSQDSSTTSEVANRQTLSKKELKRLAKEKKKMARKDAKILEASNKNK